MRLITVVVAVCSFAACDGCGTVTEQPPPVEQPTGTNLSVTSAAVRSCQAVFETAGEEVPGVVFSDAVTGEMIPRAPRFAVAFVATSDVKGVEVARFQFTRSGNGPPKLVEQRCFDANGAAVASGLQLAD